MWRGDGLYGRHPAVKQGAVSFFATFTTFGTFGTFATFGTFGFVEISTKPHGIKKYKKPKDFTKETPGVVVTTHPDVSKKAAVHGIPCGNITNGYILGVL